MSVIFSHENISIEDDGNSIKYKCPKQFSQQCKPFLAATNVMQESTDFDTYFINKTNEASIAVLSQIINQDIKKLYKPTPTILPNPFIATPTFNAGPQMLGNPVINNVGQLSAHLMAKNQKSNNLFASKPSFPNIVYTKNGANIPTDETFAVADYKENSIALYTTKEFAQKYNYLLAPLSPIFNDKLHTSATTDDRSPGWIFKKSDPNVGIMINNLTGEDTYSKISKQPIYNKKNGNSFSATNPFTNAGPLLMNNNLPALIPQTTKAEPMDPIQSFQALVESLSETLTEVKEKKLIHPLGESTHGFMGPKVLINEKVAQYLEQYQDYEAKVDAEFSVGDNKIVIISRKLTN